MKREVGITIREALSLEFWGNAKLVAGHNGIDRVIKSINIMEVPDITKWVKEGELLLSTVFAIKDDEEAQCQLIPALAERGLAGLAIKPGRYIEKIPQIMLEQADKYNFPLIELPFETSFSDFVDSILSEILNIQAVFLKKSLDTHEMLMDVVLKGGGLEEITKNIARLVGNPVAILNQNYEIQTFDLMGQLDEEDIFELDESTSVWRFKKNHLVGQSKSGRFKQNTIEGEKAMLQMSIPILVGQECYGYIFVWEVLKKLEAIDLIGIERSATVAAMEILNQQSIFEVERRYQNDLLYDLLHGRFEIGDVILSRAKAMHWELKGQFSVIIFEVPEETTPGEESRKNCLIRNQVIRDIKRICENQKREVIFGEWGTKFILLHSISGHKDDLENDIRKTIFEVQRMLESYQQTYYIGVSSPSKGLFHLKESYLEAKETIRIALITNSSKEIFYYDKLGISRILHQIDLSVLKKFLSDALGVLIQYDQKNNTELVKTLDYYFECDGNLKRLAKKLYVHYNTVLYRIERIQTILDVDFKDRDVRLNLEIALKIYY
ncbi:MAG: PucR family transcriptional regulator ligand-binding domain-containing protein [Halanaerobiales bacterium]|nr:PucR family transcriptional regulator ligand-binding domain-containing protein [Halanaerobiales bacterium]